MSFSTETKTELTRLALHSKIEALLELAAMARLGGTMRIAAGATTLRFISEHPDVIGRVAGLTRFLYGIDLDVHEQRNDRLQKHPIFYSDLPEEQMEVLLAESGVDLFGRPLSTEESLFGRLAPENHARAYLRGAFLASGSIVDPVKSYHMEIVVRSALDARMVETSGATLRLPLKQTRRGEEFVFYLKDSEAIADALVSLGASAAMLALENVKAQKEVSNEINRKSNAEIANLDKQYRAALQQIRAIRWIDRHQGLASLPKGLQDLAAARLARPMANMRELGESMTPPLGKSGVMHRMRRLMDIAREEET
ncbi:MAG: DNA-binding protein WhiA [Peptoniphilaceae bacterium]|nr:DNA-binding protein WhiA [Peptoniphilaceae bacterium]MDY6085811.1 DNA-binding protein WhiA [Peptoniphilaceae bacterium]